MLSTLDYYSLKYPKDHYVDVSFYFVVPVMLSTFLSGPFCPYFGEKIHVNIRVALSFLLVGLTYAFNIVIAMHFNNWNGFGMSIVIFFISGFIDNVNSNGLIMLGEMCSV